MYPQSLVSVLRIICSFLARIDQETYQKEYNELSAQYGEEMNRIGEIGEEARSREMRKKQIELFLRMFEKQEVDMEFDAGTYVAIVERVVARWIEERKVVYGFILRSENEYRIRIN